MGETKNAAPEMTDWQSVIGWWQMDVNSGKTEHTDGFTTRSLTLTLIAV